MSQRSKSLPPKPSSVAKSTAPAQSPVKGQPHELECLIQRRLQSQSGLKFTRLTVHQCPQGVCLEGLLETNDDDLDLCDLVREFAGVKAINRVVMRPALPK